MEEKDKQLPEEAEQEQLPDLTELEPLPESEEGDQEFDLDEILKEFAGDGTEAVETETEAPEVEPAQAEANAPVADMGDTVRLSEADIEKIRAAEASEPVADSTMRFTPPETPEEPAKQTEWTAETMSGFAAPQPIVFRPRSRLRELKRKLVAGPERRYYEINEQGFAKLQMAMFLNFLVVILSVSTTAVYALGMVPAERMKLMVFGQLFAMMFSALLGSYQMMDGVADIFRLRFSPNSMLLFTFVACCADGFFCLQELRVPCCAAFCLQVGMSLWGAYQRRSREMGQMDTMRKAVRLDSVVRVPGYYDGCSGLLRGEGQVESFMDQYNRPSAPERVLSVYCLLALLASIGLGVATFYIHGSVTFGLRVAAATMLASMPVTIFITLSRPEAILQRRLHKVGAVLCGWKGIRALGGRAVFPITHEDLFPAGSCKLNGVKFYGTRDPDSVVAYTAAVIRADGGGLDPLFEQLLNNRSGIHYEVENFRCYENGGIGAEVCQEPVLVGSLSFLKEMGVEIPEGTRVNQAVYVAIDGEFSGLFAVTYGKLRAVSSGLSALCGYLRLRPVLISSDFVLTESFLRSRFGINTRKVCFPERQDRGELAQRRPEEDAPAGALITGEGLLPFTYAVAGARSLRTAWTIGTVLHLLGGLVGLGMMAVLAYLNAEQLLTPQNLLMYELVWLIPGLLVTEWTRTV